MSESYGSDPGQYQANPSPEPLELGASSDSLDLGAVPFTPTQPGPVFIDPFGPEPGYSPASGAESTYESMVGQGYAGSGYGLPNPQPYAQPTANPPQQPVTTYAEPPNSAYSGYSVYDPASQAAPQTSYAVQPYSQPYAQANAQVGMLVPGQIVQTPYGTFVVGDKSKIAAGLLGIFLGGFGVGQFYRGNVGMGVLQIVVTLVSCGAGYLWGLIEGIVVLVSKPGAPQSLDSKGQIMA